MTTERISRELALERIRHHVHERLPSPELLPLMDCLGLVSAQDVFAVHAVPAHPRSAVDGYALDSAATLQAAETSQLRLPLCGRIRPSTESPAALAAGQAVEILTGGRLPEGADCVVPQEDADIESGLLVLKRPAAPGDHVLAAGSSLMSGTRIARRGEDLNPQVLAALAISGTHAVPAHRPPSALVLAIGNELADISQPPPPGRMPADNLLLAAGLLKSRGLPEVTARICANEPEEIVRQLSDESRRCVITTGGTGPGKRDFMLQAARAAGFTPFVESLCLIPGKSMFVAGRGERLLFALPGTPWGVFALMHAIVLPALCWMRGRTLPVPGPILARPSLPPQSPQPGWERLVPCTVSAIGAELQAHPLLDRSRESRLDMLEAHGLLICNDSPDELLRMIPVWENRRGHRLS